MLTRRRCTILAAGILLGALGLAIFLNTATAGKPPPPPPPPPPPAANGSICFWYQGQASQVWSMNGDGSSKHTVAPPSFDAVPSSKDYGGRTWWLCVQDVPNGGYYPPPYESIPVRELYAVRTTAQNVTYAVQLTDLASLGIAPQGGSAEWSNDLADSFVSFTGFDIAEKRSYMYRADIDLPDDGADPVLFGLEVPTGGGHWSPDGTRIVYSGTSSNGRTTSVYVYDVATEQATEIFDTGLIGGDVNPRWSPPGVPDRIAFCTSGYRLCTIAPDGTNLAVVYDQGTKSWSDYLKLPHWSPDGKYLACRHVLAKMSKGGVATYWSQITIVPSAGGSAKILTADMATSPYMEPVAWRGSAPVP